MAFLLLHIGRRLRRHEKCCTNHGSVLHPTNCAQLSSAKMEKKTAVVFGLAPGVFAAVYHFLSCFT